MDTRILTSQEATYVPMFMGGNFMDETVRKPVEGANCNVAFPASWGHWQCAMWRKLNDCPGCGWTYEDGFIAVGPRTVRGQMIAKFFNWVFRHNG